MAAWSLIEKVLGPKPPDAAPPAEVAEAPEPPRVAPGRGPLDDVGQASEHVRERVSHLSVRLEDLKSLADDFGQIVQPLNEFVVQHAQTRSRLLETEALLSRERELSGAARAELNEVNATASRTSSELSAALAELRSLEDGLREQDATVVHLRLRVDDQAALLESVEKQLTWETDRAHSLTEDNQALRLEIERLEQFKSRAENELVEIRDQFAASNAENARLQQLAESLSHRTASLKSQMLELEPQIQVARQEISILQNKLATEQDIRQKVETYRDVERSAQIGEISSLTMKIEGLNAHIATTDKIVSNIRDQLRDKSEALRVSEKTLKEALAERASVERRVEASQEASSRQAAQLTEVQRANTELKDRCEMLGKALSAKEAQIESGARKAANLASRIDQMTARFEQERSSLEAANRRLIEELQSEKAERSLAQGALDIARNSRSNLLAQYTALKRQQSSIGGSRGGGAAFEEDTEARVEPPDNVRILKGQDRME